MEVTLEAKTPEAPMKELLKSIGTTSWTDINDALQQRDNSRLNPSKSEYNLLEIDDTCYADYSRRGQPHVNLSCPIPEISSPPTNNVIEQMVKQPLSSVTIYGQLLNSAGLHLAHKILWTVAKSFPHIEFAPTIAPITCLLLVYLPEAQALVTLMKLLEKSNHLLKMNASRPFLTFRRTEFIRFVKVALAFCERTLPQLVTHVQKIGVCVDKLFRFDFQVDIAAWFARVLQDGFSQLLPFNVN